MSRLLERISCANHVDFILGWLPANQCYATWREDSGHQALVELHGSEGEAYERLKERVDFQRLVDGDS